MSRAFQLHEIAEKLDEWVKSRFGRGGCFYHGMKNQINLYADRRDHATGFDE